MSRNMTKPTKWPVCAQRRLGSDWAAESSLCAQWVAKDLMFLHGDSEDSHQTGRMPRLIGVFAGRTCHIVGFFVTRLTLQPVFILLIIICITTFSKKVCPGQNMQQTFSKFVEIYFCLCQNYKIGFLHGKFETKGNHFCRKIQLPIKTLYKKNLRKMLLKPYLWWPKLLNQIVWKGILWKYSIRSLKIADSVWLSLFMRDNGRSDIPHAA